MHPVLDCDLARLRHTGLRTAARPVARPFAGRVALAAPGATARPAARWSTEVTALLLRRSIAVAERRAARLERDTVRLSAALADVEARARTTRGRLA